MTLGPVGMGDTTDGGKERAVARYERHRHGCKGLYGAGRRSDCIGTIGGGGEGGESGISSPCFSGMGHSKVWTL